MNIQTLEGPFFLPRPKGENSGVDFLGLRQANLDMMAELIPGINNVTNFIRPFSLLCWVHWKIPALCEKAGIETVTDKEFRAFRERIEVLFTWGARLAGFQGLPGQRSDPPSGETVPLNFAAWNRSGVNTSLIAAVQYGPATKTVTGLGFLSPVRSGVFRTVGHGVALAKALDGVLRQAGPRYERLLSTLDEVEGSAEDAEGLWPLWSPENLTEEEQTIFAMAIFGEAHVGDYGTALGKRSNTIELARLFLTENVGPATANEIRKGMVFSQTMDGRVYDLPEALVPAHEKWVILQMRQLQRFAMESLLSWCEQQIFDGAHDSASLAQRLFAAWQESGLPGSYASDTQVALAAIRQSCDSLEVFVDLGRDEGLHSPFVALARIRDGLLEGKEPHGAACVYGIFLCAAFASCVSEQPVVLRTGQASRWSLYHLERRLSGLGDLPMRRALAYIIEALLISQHFATAVNRFDGQNQRLRLTIEDTGLQAMVSNPLVPTVTEDRLPTILSLAAESALVGKADADHYCAHA